MGKTNIPWCTDVWNPLSGCTRVSPGCDNCHAFKLHDQRYAANRSAGMAGGGYEPNPKPFPRQYDQPFSTVQLLPDRLDQPLGWRKPRRVFVDSMSDLFHEDVPFEFVDEVMQTMHKARQHTFLILTKRPERMRTYMKGWLMRMDGSESPPGTIHPLPNVQLGVSVENQVAADERTPLLLQTPAATRFLSVEPMLGPVELDPTWIGWCRAGYDHGAGKTLLAHRSSAGMLADTPALAWVVAGGESGPRHRPMDLAWPLDLQRQCDAARVPFFFKQIAGPRSGMASGIAELDEAKAVV